MFIKVNYALLKDSFSLRGSSKFALWNMLENPFEIYIHEDYYALIATEDINFII